MEQERLWSEIDNADEPCAAYCHGFIDFLDVKDELLNAEIDSSIYEAVLERAGLFDEQTFTVYHAYMSERLCGDELRFKFYKKKINKNTFEVTVISFDDDFSPAEFIAKLGTVSHSGIAPRESE